MEGSEETEDRGELERRLEFCNTTIAAELNGGFDRAIVAKAMHERAWMLDGLGRKEEALAAFAEIQRMFGGDVDGAVQTSVIRAGYRAAELLWREDRSAEAVGAADALIAWWDQAAPERDLDYLVAAYAVKASALLNLKQPEEALVVAEATIARFADDADSEVRAEVQRLMFSEGVALARLKRHAEAAEAWRAIVDSHADTPRPEWPKRVRTAELNLVRSQAADDRDAAVELCDRIIDDVLDDPEWLMTAVEARLKLIVADDSPDYALAQLDDLLSRLDLGAGQPLRPQAYDVRHWKLWWLLQGLRIGEAIRFSDELLERFAAAGERDEVVAIAETLGRDAHTFQYHARFHRTRHKPLLRFAIWLSDLLSPVGLKLSSHGRLGATIELRRRLRGQSVRICEALRTRLRDTEDDRAAEIYRMAVVMEVTAWTSSLHLIRASHPIMETDNLVMATVMRGAGDTEREAGHPFWQRLCLYAARLLVESDER